MNEIPVNPALLEAANWVGADPGKVNVVTFSTGEKLPATAYYSAVRAAPTPGPIDAVAEKRRIVLAAAKDAESRRAQVHFGVLTSEGLWAAAAVAKQTMPALTKQYARPACLKRALSVYGRVQARAVEIVAMVKKGADVSKPTVVALGRNYQGRRARLGDKWTPVCKVVLNLLSVHFAVVLIDEYLTSQMCWQCRNKLVARQGEPREKYCLVCQCEVDRDVNAAKNILEKLLFHIRGWGCPAYMCRPVRHLLAAEGPAAPAIENEPQTAEV
jgi:hypothetical protein